MISNCPFESQRKKRLFSSYF